MIKPGCNCYSLVQHADFRGQAVLSISVFVEVLSNQVALFMAHSSQHLLISEVKQILAGQACIAIF